MVSFVLFNLLLVLVSVLFFYFVVDIVEFVVESVFDDFNLDDFDVIELEKEFNNVLLVLLIIGDFLLVFNINLMCLVFVIIFGVDIGLGLF